MLPDPSKEINIQTPKTTQQTRFTNYTIITIQTKDKQNISINKLYYKQIKKITLT